MALLLIHDVLHSCVCYMHRDATRALTRSGAGAERERPQNSRSGSGCPGAGRSEAGAGRSGLHTSQCEVYMAGG